MDFTLAKVIFVVYVIIEVVAGTPLRNSAHEDHGSQSSISGFFSPFLTPVKKVHQYFMYGNLFTPAVAYPNYNEAIYPKQKEPFYEYNRKKPIIDVPTASPKYSVQITTKFSNVKHETTTSKSIVTPDIIDKNILDRIFDEIDQNSITTTEDTTIEYTTGTGDYETTTDYLLRIPAPVIATLLG